MKRFLARYFPTFAAFGYEDWIMLGLTAGISWGILYGVALPYIIDPYHCFDGFGPVCY
jgi:hypothetical protein